MIDPQTLRIWLFRLVLLALAGGVAFVLILPLSFNPAGLPGPDLILALIFAWVLRRPEYVPVPLVAAIVFLMDMLLLNPPGLHAALVVIGVEFLRQRGASSTDLPFAVEWGLVMVVMGMILLGQRLVLAIFVVEQIEFGKEALRLVISWSVYPLVVAFSVYILGVRRVQPGDADALRQGL
ncbi:MAG: rod shape-determining protein MreD [Rhodobacteraceae bacterium]|nr:rod shape-determining protein MreD [Paracoccaceae bacterium]